MKEETKPTLRKPSTYQPTKAELEADVNIPTTPDQLLGSVINFKPPEPSEKLSD